MAATLIVVACALGVAATVVWAALRSAAAAREVREDATRQRALQLLALLAPGAVAARDDPKALLAWYPVADLARRLFPAECTALDQAAGAPFPFGAAQIEDAHTRWTSAWLAWEAAHDAEFKLRTATLEQELGSAAATGVGRARLEAVGREKLAQYQQRYEDYTRISRLLRTLAERNPRPAPSGSGTP
jgi:hypothetical protein